MKKLYLLLLISCISCVGFAQVSTFGYTGAVQTYTVPNGIYSLAVDIAGAAGGAITYGGTGGSGGRVLTTINVTPNTQLFIYIGRKGAPGSYTFGAAPAGGNNSGGGADGGNGSSYDGGGAGGGSSDIRTVSGSNATALSSRIVVAGGGGGGGYFCSGAGENGGGGGGLTGGTGLECGSYNAGDEGTPGTQTTFGLKGTYFGFSGTYSGTNGAFGKGGRSYNNYGGYGGGGGGWFGAGGAAEGGGCGGSSYTAPGITVAVSHTQGYSGATNDGYARITPICNPPGNIIVNANPLCLGSVPLSITNPTGSSHGTWSSSDNSVVSLDPTTGAISGVAPGTTTITFNLLGSCSIVPSVVVSVNPVPAAITGTFNVCTGLVTTLADATSGGTWSSLSPSLATVDAFGNVTGAGIGIDSIHYTLPGGCFSSKPVTVNGSPGAIGGNSAVCQNQTTALTDPVLGGSWASSALSVATIDVFGNVTGVSTSTSVTTTNITYTLSNGCNSSKTFSVNPLPIPFVVSGSNAYCAGSLSTTNIVLIGSTSGVSYQLYNGPAIIGSPLPGSGSALNFGIQSAPGTYTVIGTNTATGCVNTMLLSATVSVKPLPAQFTVTGGGSFCDGGLGAPIGLSGSAVGVSYKLYQDGSPTAVSINGTGSPLNFGFQSATGSYTVVASSGGTPNCSITMTGSAAVIANPLPAVNNVTGGGAYCAGGGGVAIGLDFSNSGISYQLYKGTTAVGTPVLGTDGPIYFGLHTALGSDYHVVGTNVATTCVNDMAGTASISIAPPISIYAVTGGGTGCAGTSFAIGLSGSDPGVDYQIYKGTTAIGSAVPGVSGPFDIASLSVSGTYKVVATDETYHCVANMTGSAVIVEQALPTVYNMPSGGGYCEGGAGVPIVLSGSQSGVNYSLYYNTTFVDSFPGTGSSLNLGTYMNAGSYTVVADNPATGCVNDMNGIAVVAVNPLPVAYNLIGGGSHCAGSGGVDIGLDQSSAGVNYQLYNGGVATGALMPGTGDAIDFGFFTASGTYTVVGTNPTTTCTANMSGSAVISTSPLPVLHSVTGGGSYCSGGAGPSVGVAGSDAGISYQLYNGSTALGAPVPGSGSPINFGIQSLAGSYTVVATNTTTSCTVNMPGGATIVISASPAAFNVTGGGAFCAGTSGTHIGLAGSNSGVNYALYNSGGVVRTIPGSGLPIDFGLETATGTYTVVGTSVTNGCTSIMNDSAVIIPSLPPTAYSVIGGGSYCSGTSVIPSVGLSSSNEGIMYQLYKSGTAAGSPAGGTGAAIDFGAQVNGGVYTIVGTDTTTGCVRNMSGSATVVVNALPQVNTVTGGGSYCAGGAGSHIYLSSSSVGIQYQLSNGGGPVSTIMGTGAGVDFGLIGLAGTYTAVATNLATGCTSNMAGSANININATPIAFGLTVSNGGNYCATGAGVHVGIDGSASGINYQLYNGASHVGSAVAGTGSAIDFGVFTAGNYTVVGSNAATGCATSMTGSGMVTAIPLPNSYAVTGGGNYCSTGLGLHLGLSGSDPGTVYQLYHGATAIGAPVTGTSGGGPVDFGPYTAAGTYTAIATNGGATGCNNNMSGTSVITVYPVIVPMVSIMTAGGGIACLGEYTHFTANSINGGSAPSYEWMVNGTMVGSGNTYTYLPADGDMVTARVHSNGICAIPDTASSTISMTVTYSQLPSVTVAATPGDVICEGSPVTFTGTGTFGGTHPVFTWIKNSAYVVGSGMSYTYTPNNGDIIMLRMVSDFPCRLADTVFSVTHNMVVEPPIIPVVNIAVEPGDKINAGQSTLFTATVDHGGASAVYQWLINDVAVPGATNATFVSSTLNNNDSVTCEVTGGCNLKGFNSIHMHVASTGVHQVASGSGKIQLVPNPNKGIFTVKGTLASTGDEEVTIEITNTLGQIVYSNKAIAHAGAVNEKIQLNSSLANGMYILSLHSSTQDNVFHFVIEQ